MSQRKTWVAEVFQPQKEGQSPFYLFHCTDADAPAWPAGKPYLYSGRGFVRAEHPASAILIQQLLNDGQLTVKPIDPETNPFPINPDTNDLPK